MSLSHAAWAGVAKCQEWYDKPIDTNTRHMEVWGEFEWLGKRCLFYTVLINYVNHRKWSQEAANCQSFFSCLIPNFLSHAPFTHFHLLVVPELQDFGLHCTLWCIYFSLAMCLVSYFCSASLTASFSLCSHVKILICHRGDSPDTAFIWMVLSEWFVEKKSSPLLWIITIVLPSEGLPLLPVIDCEVVSKLEH